MCAGSPVAERRWVSGAVEETRLPHPTVSRELRVVGVGWLPDDLRREGRVNKTMKITVDLSGLGKCRFTNPASWWTCPYCGYVVGKDRAGKLCPHCYTKGGKSWLPGVWHPDGTMCCADEVAL